MSTHDEDEVQGDTKSAGVVSRTLAISRGSEGEQWLEKQKRKINGQRSVSFQNLNVFGYHKATSFQRTFSSYILLLPTYFRELFGHKNRTQVNILQELDGVVHGGEMLLVLGRPGSGCTTFLKTIAGNHYGLDVQQETINYQGTSYSTFHKKCRAESIYVAESDVHFPELTLAQTLEFAAKMRAPDGDFDSAEVAREVASILHLENSLNTRIGNDLIRGLSGGEKRRTSIAEAILSGANIQCWDNSTRGLDSSTALDFITFLRQSAKVLESTVMVTVYQASEEIYKIFDKVLLLYQGHQIYFGPASEAAEYFTALGFMRPPRATTPDFLTSITNPAERIVKKGYEDRVPRTPEEFAAMWKKSQSNQALAKQVQEFASINPIQDKETHTGIHHRSVYSISLNQQIKACMHRAFQRLRNNLVAPISGIVGNSLVALIFGSVFYNLPEDTSTFQARAILIYYITMLNACTPSFEVLGMWAQRPIVEKHNAYAFSHPVAEGIASIIADMPNKILTSLFSNISVYFITNLRRDAGAFFTFWVFSLTVMSTMSMLFRSVGSLSKTYEETLAPVSMIIFNFLIYAGLVVPPSYMVPWFGWIRWLNPIGYAFESLMINEFQDRTFPCSMLVPAGPGYEDGSVERTCSAVGSRPGENFVEGNAYLSAKYEYRPSSLWRNLGILLALMIFFGAVHLISTEYMEAQKSKGDILFFRRGQGPRESQATDEESVREKKGLVSNTNELQRRNEPQSAQTPDMFKGLHKQDSVFHWQKVTYELKIGKENRKILDEIDGWVKPGTLTALVGPTGAGKTTLLDVLADRRSVGVISGDMLVNGKFRDAGFQRKTGYVQQADLHLETTTVREALNFSALLRQSRSIPKAEKLAYVDTVLSMLDMEPYADAIVGVHGKGLNIEQRKRLTIAVELVARPELLLFLDEPTSGLDSQTAWSICMLLRKLANHGQAILCTIHQPSSELFQIFDRLLLLQEGKTVYFGDIGDSASTMIQYFEKNGARKYQEGENPAVWLLRVTGDLPGSTSTIDWPTVWRQSPEKVEVESHLESLQQSTTDGIAEGKDEYAASFWQQLLIVTHRLFQQYWRDPAYLYSKFALCTSAALFNGFSFWMATMDIQGLTNILFSCFLLSIIFTTVNQQIIPRFLDGAALFEAREKQSKTFSWPVFIAANFIVETLWMSLASIFTFVAWYYPIGLWKNGDPTFSMNERAGLAFLLIWFALLLASSLSQALAAGIKDALTAVNISQLLFSLVLIFSGVLLPPSQLPSFWKFMWRVSPVTYLVAGLMIAGVGNTQITCSNVETIRIALPSGGNSTCGEYLSSYVGIFGGQIMNENEVGQCLYCPVSDTNAFLSSLEIEVEDGWKDFGFLCVFVAFNVAATFALFWLARVPKAKKIQHKTLASKKE